MTNTPAMTVANLGEPRRVAEPAGNRVAECVDPRAIVGEIHVIGKSAGREDRPEGHTGGVEPIGQIDPDWPGDAPRREQWVEGPAVGHGVQVAELDATCGRRAAAERIPIRIAHRHERQRSVVRYDVDDDAAEDATVRIADRAFGVPHAAILGAKALDAGYTPPTCMTSPSHASAPGTWTPARSARTGSP